MTWVELSCSNYDVWVGEDPRWLVCPSPQTETRQGWSLCVSGRRGRKTHDGIQRTTGWEEVRWFEDRDTAERLMRLLARGLVRPEDAVTWTLPHLTTVGEVVETVGDLHRRGRRRR